MLLEKETIEAFAKCNQATQRLKDVLKNINLKKISGISSLPNAKTDKKEVTIP